MRQPVSPTFYSYARLRGEGMSRAQIRAALAAGALLRARKGRYVAGDLDDQLREVAELGARVDCISLLRRYGVFVLHHGRLHVQLTHGDSRLPPRPASVVAHWRRSAAGREDLEADLLEALVQACLCQSPRAAIATLDSAWHHGIIDHSDIAEIFSRLPRRFRPLRKLLDRRAESGPETFVRLILRSLGCHVLVQPRIEGVGRVDFLVDGWLIVECDSVAFHSSCAAQREDRRRDLAAAAAGYATFRLIAEDVFFRPEAVRAGLLALLRRHNSSRSGSMPRLRAGVRGSRGVVAALRRQGYARRRRPMRS